MDLKIGQICQSISAEKRLFSTPAPGSYENERLYQQVNLEN